MRNFEIKNLPVPFPGWDRYSEKERKISLLERWKNHKWDYFYEPEGSPRYLCGRRLVDGVESVHFWGGQDLTQFELETLWKDVRPSGPCWITCPAPAPRMHNVVKGLVDAGDVCEFVFDFKDMLFPTDASCSIASLKEEDFEEVSELVQKQKIRSREQRAGFENSDNSFLNYWQKLCGLDLAPVGAYRNKKLVGLLHVSKWCEKIELWNTSLCAVDPDEVNSFSIIQDMLLGLEARANRKINSLKVGIPIESSPALSCFMKAEPSSIWIRKIFWLEG
tara:strand:+ start:1432 stop:2262 length:831 start_codon:yes stop_codon:yes gene_type:complete